MKVDLLAFGVHPDDVEISAAGTIMKHIALGKTVVIVDLTQGELGTRGSGAQRIKEAEAAAALMGVKLRVQLNMADGFFVNDRHHQLKIIEVLRNYKPDVVLCNALNDRHPDHGRSARLVSDACFLSGLRKIETGFNHESQQPWRPKAVYHYLQDRPSKPDLLVDISGYQHKKNDVLRCYQSQFFNENSDEPETYISSQAFFNSIINRSAEYGRQIGTDHAEAFQTERFTGVNNLFDLI